MKTVIDLTELRPRVVTDPREIDRLRWFQMHRYFQGGLLDEPPTTLPVDDTVAQSTYFGVYAGDEIQATARIVHSSGALPMLEHHALYPRIGARLEASAGTVGEISRLAVGSSTPHYRALALLSREFLRYGLRNEHATLLIASVEQPMVRILNRLLGIPLHVIGPTIDQYGHYNGATVPIMLDTIECLDNFRRKESRRWEFFIEDLVVDLTESAASRPNRGRLARVAS